MRTAPATLVVELLTEELPPKSLKQLGEAFADGMAGGCASAISSAPSAVSRVTRHRAGLPCRSRTYVDRRTRRRGDRTSSCPRRWLATRSGNVRKP